LPRDSEEDDLRDSAGEGAKHRRELAEMLLPLLYAIVAELPAPRSIASDDLEGHGETADGWRSAASELTPGSTLTSGDAGAVDAGGAPQGLGSESRVTTCVDAGELGAIRLTVEKTDAGIAVHLSADDPATAARAELERASLEQALRAAGIAVASITIAANTNGIVLAPSPLTQCLNVLDTTGDAAPDDRTPLRGRAAKRLNVTG
jgi:hypothetical protein